MEVKKQSQTSSFDENGWKYVMKFLAADFPLSTVKTCRFLISV